jgi:MFS family permease
MPAFAVEYRQVYMTYGMAAVTFMLLRSARTVLLPLVGVRIGLDTVSIGFVVAVSAAVDVLLFYPAGLAMDRFGRRATAIPSCVLFSAVLLSLAAADSYADLLCAAVAAGVANGLSTGIVMTLGTDLAPAARRGEFLGLWRLLTDAGSALGPMTISFLIAAVSVPAASLGVGILGAGGSYVVYRYVAETLQRSR